MGRKVLIYTLLAVLMTACSTTRHIPEGEQLYTGIKEMKFIGEKEFAQSETGKTAVDEISSALSYAPNGSFVGSSSIRTFSVGLWFYNTFYHSKKGIGKWLFDRFGTSPVLVSKVNPELRAEVASDILKYYGYFNGRAEATVTTDK